MSNLETLMLAFDALMTAADKIATRIQEAQKEGAILTDEQQATLDKVTDIRKKVGLPDDSQVPPGNG